MCVRKRISFAIKGATTTSRRAGKKKTLIEFLPPITLGLAEQTT